VWRKDDNRAIRCEKGEYHYLKEDAEHELLTHLSEKLTAQDGPRIGDVTGRKGEKRGREKLTEHTPKSKPHQNRTS